MSEPEATFYRPVEFNWSAETYRVRQMVREFLGDDQQKTPTAATAGVGPAGESPDIE